MKRSAIIAGNAAALLHTYFDAPCRRDLDAIEALLLPVCAWTYAQVSVHGSRAVHDTRRRTVALIDRTRHHVDGLVQSGDLEVGEILAQRQINDETFTLTETAVCGCRVGRIVRLDSYLNPEETQPYVSAMHDTGRRADATVGGVPV